jgi:methyl-accepting chemotaxis protein
VAEEISKDIADVNLAADEMSKDSSQVNDNAGKLRGLSEGLKKTVDQFKV